MVNYQKSNNMIDAVAGINEEELNSLSLEIIDRKDRISEILEKINACMGRLEDRYQGPPYDKIMQYYEELSASYPTIKENIKSYSDDFQALINKMHENEKLLAGLFQDLTDEVNKQANTINSTLDQ